MRCVNCGWDNNPSDNDCKKCGHKLHHISNSSTELNANVDRIMRDQRRGIGVPDRYHISPPCEIKCTILSPQDYFRIEFDSDYIEKNEGCEIERDRIRHVLDTIGKLNLDTKPIRYYVCPVCGNILIEKKYPFEFGDDLVCECPDCRNSFEFGGTYFESPESTLSYPLGIFPFEHLSANYIQLARATMYAKSRVLANFLGGFTVLTSDSCIIVKKADGLCLVAGLLKLII